SSVPAEHPGEKWYESAMRITRADVIRYRGASPGARSATLRWSDREGALLRLSTPDGRVGQGEASPLPGYSSDTLETGVIGLGRIDWERVPEPDVAETARSFLSRARAAAGTLTPSAAFAFETALLDVLGQRQNAPIWALLGDARGEVPLSFFVGGADD